MGISTGRRGSELVSPDNGSRAGLGRHECGGKKRIMSRRRFETLCRIGEQVAESLSGNFLP